MKLKYIVFIGFLLSILCPSTQWSKRFLESFLVPMKRFVEWQELAWFISPHLKTDDVEYLDEFIKELGMMMGCTQFVFSNNTDIKLLHTDSKVTIMSMVFVTSFDDPILEVHSKVLLGRHFLFTILIIAQKLTDISMIERICWDLYKRNFVNILIYFQLMDGKNQLYGYNIYPKYEIENRTEIERIFRAQYKKTIAGVPSVEGYAYVTPIRQDLPRVFKYKERDGNEVILGSTYRLFSLFVNYSNGTIKELDMPKDALGGQIVDMKAVLNLVREKEIDFSAHAYALFMPDDEIDKSYPIKVVKWCLMVPLHNSVSTYFYPVQPFDWIVWIIVIIVFLILNIVDFLWIYVRQRDHKEKKNVFIFYSNIVLDNFCYIINIATAKNINAPAIIRFLFLVTIFFHGFFLSANYTSFLGSFLTVSLFRDQINTIDDIVAAQLNIMIIDYELEFLLSVGYELTPALEKLIKPVDAATFNEHQSTLNTSYAYFVTDDKWSFLQQKQSHLKQGIFKFSDICFGSYHMAFPLQTDSPTWRNLKYYIIHVHSSGLLDLYEKTVFQSAVHAGYIQRISEVSEYTSAGIQHLAFVFVLMGTMYMIGFIILLIELYWKRKSILKNQ